MSRFDDILARKAAADAAKAKREEDARRKVREREEAERKKRQREVRRAEQAKHAAGDPQPLLDLLQQRWVLELPKESSAPVAWEEVRDVFRKDGVDGMLIPDRLPEGWAIYRLSDEEAAPFADYATGDGWLLVTPAQTWIVVPGEMGETVAEFMSESAAREAIQKTVEAYREELGEEDDDET